jgi:hypothetical protein
VKDYYQSVLNDEVAIPGFLSVAQSFGHTLNHHAHIHAISTQGIFMRDGTFLNCTKIEATAIKELFMNHTFTMLLEEKKIDIDQTLSRADSPQQRQY